MLIPSEMPPILTFPSKMPMVMTNAKVSTAWAMPLPKNKVCNHSILTYFCANCQQLCKSSIYYRI